VVTYKCTQCSTFEEKRTLVTKPQPPDRCDVCGNDSFEYIGDPEKERSLARKFVAWLNQDVEDMKWIPIIIGLFFLYLLIMGEAYAAFHTGDSSTLTLMFIFCAAVFAWFFYNGLRG
jgi:hypothetical protein